MSTVHLAFDERLERHVAVKLLAEHLAADPAFVSRFQREALAAARLIHPNIVQVFDSGLDDHRDQHFIVMEYIEGQSCAEILRERGWLEVDEAVSIVVRRAPASTTRTARASCTATSSPATCCAARARGQARRLRHRQGDRAVEHHAGRLGARHRRLPRPRAGPRRGGRPAAPTSTRSASSTYQLISGRLPFEGASLTELAIKQQREPPPRSTRSSPPSPPSWPTPSRSRCASTRASATRRRRDGPRGEQGRARHRARAPAAGAAGHGDRGDDACSPPATAEPSPRARGRAHGRGAPAAAGPAAATRRAAIAAQPKPRRRGRRVLGALLRAARARDRGRRDRARDRPAVHQVMLRNVGYSDADQVVEALQRAGPQNTQSSYGAREATRTGAAPPRSAAATSASRPSRIAARSRPSRPRRRSGCAASAAAARSARRCAPGS